MKFDAAFNNAGIMMAPTNTVDTDNATFDRIVAVNLEEGAQGIRVNAVCPGTITTPMVERMVVAGELDTDASAAADFQPPRPRFVSWEIARMTCDPRTVMLSDEWRVRLPDLLASYQ